MTIRTNIEAPNGTAGQENMTEAIGAVADALRASMRQGRMPFLEVSSNSMAPLLYQGDRIGLAAVPPSQLCHGDIVTFVENSHFTTHRFWSANGEFLYSRGDRNPAFDQPWRQDVLIGRVVVRERAGNPLWLDHGTGRSLNRLLCAFSRWETQLLDWGLPTRPVRAGIRSLSVVTTSLADWRRRVA